MQSVKSLHKWLFSFVLLVSLTSFSGAAQNTAKPAASTIELVVVEQPVTSAYYFSFLKYDPVTSLFEIFVFDAFLWNQHTLIKVEYQVQTQIALHLERQTTVLPLKQIPLNGEDSFHYFIG